MLKGVSGTFVLKVFHTGAAFVLSIVLARMLGVEGFGIYTYAISWITLLGVFANLGLGDIVTREVARSHQHDDWGRIRGIIQFSLLANLVAGTLCLLAGVAAVAWLYRDSVGMAAPLLMAFVALPLAALRTPVSGAAMGLQRVVVAQLPLFVVQPLLFFALLVSPLVFFGVTPSPFQAVLFFVLSVVGALIAAAFILFRIVRQLRQGAVWPRPSYEAVAWLKAGAPLLLFGGMFLVNANADILMLGSMVGPEAAAVYKAVTRGAELVTLSLVIIGPSLKPLIVRLHERMQMSDLQRALQRAARAAFVASLLVSVLLLGWGDWFLALYGGDFERGRTALSILVVAHLLNVAGGAAEVGLVMMGHEKLAAIGLLGAAVANLLLNALLIPEYGIEGAAVATGLSIVVMKVGLVAFVYRTEGLNLTVSAIPSKIQHGSHRRTDQALSRNMRD